VANFNNNAVTVFQTAEEAAITIANSTANGSGAGQLEHDVLLDAVQTLALGDISLTAVIGTGISLALQDGGYQVGRTYDYFDANQTAYGSWLYKLTQELTSATPIVDRMVFKGSYSKGVSQLTITSDLIEPTSGDKYFEIVRQDYYVSSDSVSGTRVADKTIGLRSALKLYVEDLNTGRFYFLEAGRKIGVYLCDQRAYGTALAMIKDNGRDAVLPRYLATLNTLSTEQVEQFKTEAQSGAKKRNAAQQKLFLSVFKNIKSTIVSILPTKSAVESTN